MTWEQINNIGQKEENIKNVQVVEMKPACQVNKLSATSLLEAYESLQNCKKSCFEHIS